MVSLVFCVESSLWTSMDPSRLSLHAKGPLINPEMISVPMIREKRINKYICLHFKINDLDVNENMIKVSQLLKKIQPTQEKQNEDDRNNVERSVSTTLSYVKDNYKLKELKVVYKRMTDDWDRDVLGVEFPAKGLGSTKIDWQNIRRSRLG